MVSTRCIGCGADASAIQFYADDHGPLCWRCVEPADTYILDVATVDNDVMEHDVMEHLVHVGMLAPEDAVIEMVNGVSLRLVPTDPPERLTACNSPGFPLLIDEEE